jgi:hypothetical protein
VAGEFQKRKQKYRKSDWKSELTSINETNQESNTDNHVKIKRSLKTKATELSEGVVFEDHVLSKIPKSAALLPKISSVAKIEVTKVNMKSNVESQKSEKTPAKKFKDLPKRDFIIRLNPGSDEKDQHAALKGSTDGDMMDSRTRRKTIGSYALPSLKK